MNKVCRQRMRGFTLIELLVVVLIIGILASIAIPQYFRIVEKGRFAESTSWVDGVRSAQERLLVKNSSYCTSGNYSACGFDMDPGSMRYFSPSILAAGTAGTAGAPGWSITLTRQAPLPSLYSNYSLTYDRNAASPLSCSNSSCVSDLMP